MAKIDQDSDTPRRGRMSRAGSATFGYAQRRFRSSATNKASAAILKGGARIALEGFDPRDIDVADMRTGYKGRHADGGRAAFAEMVKAQDLSGAQLERMRADHTRAGAMFVAAAVVAVVASPFMMITATDLMFAFTSIAVLLFALVFGALAVRHFFFAWQISHRSVGALGDYLAGRKPQVRTGIVVHTNTEVL